MPEDRLGKELREDYDRRFAAARPHWERFDAIASELGQTARTFALAGIALVWIFRGPSTSVVEVPPVLGVAAFLFIASLAADLLRLFFAAVLADHNARHAFLQRALKGAEKHVDSLLTFLQPERLLLLVEVGAVTSGFGLALWHIWGIVSALT